MPNADLNSKGCDYIHTIGIGIGALANKGHIGNKNIYFFQMELHWLAK